MMAVKCLVVFCCVLSAVMADEKYTDKYDNIDLNEVINNRRLLLAYIDCILDKGKCSPEGKELKDHLQEALETGCEKCTETQQSGTETMISHLVTNEKEIWEQLTAKFDPTGKYRKKYEDLAKERGIVLPN